MRIVRLLFVLVLALGIAACGGGGDDDAGSTRKAGSDSTKPAKDDGSEAGNVQADLRIRLTHVGDRSSGAGIPVPTGIACTKKTPATCHGTLTCPSTEKSDDGLCAWIAVEGAEVFAKPPEHQACTEQYGGPEVATVEGTFDGQPVKATFTRTNGCEIARFDLASPLWTGEVNTPPDTAAPPTEVPPGADPDAPVSTTPQPEEIVDPPEAFDR
jgi:hypothetical protein